MKTIKITEETRQDYLRLAKEQLAHCERALGLISRKRSWRPSEKAMAHAGYKRDMIILQSLVKDLT